MDADEERKMAIRIFAYTCAAIGRQKRSLCDWLLAEVRDGPHRLIELADEGLFVFSTAVTDEGTQLCAHLRDPASGKTAILAACNAKNLGVSEETMREWGQMAAESGNVHITVPDHPEDD